MVSDCTGKLDRAYDDRMAARITDELSVRKSGSNSTFDRGSLSVAFVKPFDLLVEGLLFNIGDSP